MTNRIHEHKIIALQAIIFISLLVMLSFILEGCTLKNSNIDRIDNHYLEVGNDFLRPELLITLS